MRIACIAALVLAASPLATAQARDPLATGSGLEVGAQIAGYEYVEPNIAKLSGNRLGVVGNGTLSNVWGDFARVELRESYGRLKYEGSGTKSGVPDLILEARALVGRDWIGTSASLTTYLGLGYRYLLNDLRGSSSSGAAGYRRSSNYLYAPLGLTARFRLGGDWVLAPTVEADVFLVGKQVSQLSDTGIPGLTDVTNTQRSGRGHRGSLMLEKDRLIFGVWANYWHIDKSDVQSAGGITGFEPDNTTREWGLEVRYRF